MPELPKRVLCLGDSITWAGHWVDQIDALYAVRHPAAAVEVLNLGLPSETVSGLSEPGHAGGAFPRPVLRERLDRVLDRVRPDAVVACYGMNDGIYLPLDEQRFKAFRDGIDHLEQSVRRRGARFHLLTPAAYDRTRAAPDAKFDYDDVLARYADWLRRRSGTRAADARGPLLRHLAARRRRNPDYRLADDGVHLSPLGHWFLAEAAATTLGISREPAPVDIAETEGRMAPSMPIPMPIDPAWDADAVRELEIRPRWGRSLLRMPDADDRRHVLSIGASTGIRATGDALRRGVDIASLPGSPLVGRAVELLALVVRRQRLLRDAWLSETGHQRPGLPQGRPLAEAKAEAARIGEAIGRLAEPMAVSVDPRHG